MSNEENEQQDKLNIREQKPEEEVVEGEEVEEEIEGEAEGEEEGQETKLVEQGGQAEAEEVEVEDDKKTKEKKQPPKKWFNFFKKKKIFI